VFPHSIFPSPNSGFGRTYFAAYFSRDGQLRLATCSRYLEFHGEGGRNGRPQRRGKGRSLTGGRVRGRLSRDVFTCTFAPDPAPRISNGGGAPSRQTSGPRRSCRTGVGVPDNPRKEAARVFAPVFALRIHTPRRHPCVRAPHWSSPPRGQAGVVSGCAPPCE
jgi:hypothetical protein